MTRAHAHSRRAYLFATNFPVVYSHPPPQTRGTATLPVETDQVLCKTHAHLS